MPTAPQSVATTARWFVIACAALVLGGFLLRLYGIGDRMLCHPENFAPGLDLPAWVRFPPPRHDLVSVLRGTLIDGHPPTYFVALLPWAETFGASFASLRMPSALLGALSIGLIALIALREGKRTTALLAAALLALHGHHLYWSQMARMYVPTAFLALLSTWYFLRLRERGRAFDLWAFFATTTLALWTQLYAWPFVFAQMIAGLLLDARERRAPVGLRVQLLAVIAALPVAQLSIYQDPPSRWHEAASEYLELGYLFYSRAHFLDGELKLAWSGPWLLALGVALLAIGALARRAPAVVASATNTARIPKWFSIGVVAATTLALFGFARFAPPRDRIDATPLWAIAAMPLVLGLLSTPLERRLARATVAPKGLVARIAAFGIPMSWVLAVVPFVCMVLVSSARGAFVARGTIVFTPFLLLAVAHGLIALTRVRWLGLTSIALVLALHVASVRYIQRAESSPRDYRGLAAQLASKLAPSDRILVKNDFSSPPLIYYLRDFEAQLVHRDYAATIAASPQVSRVWLPHADEHTTPTPMLDAVAGLVPTDVLRAPGLSATAYERP